MQFATRPAWLAWPVVALLLSGCVETLPEVTVGHGDIRNAIAKGSMASPRPATVALASFEGAPPPLAARFDQIFAKEASDREIAVVDAKSARYLVRGYLSAQPSDRGTELAYVYDIFDADQRRVDRVNDVLTVPAHAQDAWALLDDKTITSLASRSADDLAMVLAGMPEARAASGAAHTAALPTAEKSAQ